MYMHIIYLKTHNYTVKFKENVHFEHLKFQSVHCKYIIFVQYDKLCSVKINCFHNCYQSFFFFSTFNKLYDILVPLGLYHMYYRRLIRRYAMQYMKSMLLVHICSCLMTKFGKNYIGFLYCDFSCHLK